MIFIATDGSGVLLSASLADSLMEHLTRLPSFPTGLVLLVTALGLRFMLRAFVPVVVGEKESYLGIWFWKPLLEETGRLLIMFSLLALNVMAGARHADGSAAAQWIQRLLIIQYLAFVVFHISHSGRRWVDAFLIGGATTLLYWAFFCQLNDPLWSLTLLWSLIQIGIVCALIHIIYNIAVVALLVK